MSEKYTHVVRTTQDYYDSNDADNFYANIWGGEDIHIGMYYDKEDSIYEASRRTVEKMASLLKGAKVGSKVLDVGSGYGGAARFLAKNFGYKVDCLNLSKQQNDRNKKINKENNLDKHINIVDGAFEDMPFQDAIFDVVWSGDAILHSADKEKVLENINRVLQKNGEFIFTDPMQTDDCPPGVLKPVLDRIHLDSLGSIGFYREKLKALGLEEIQIIEMSDQLVMHYSRVLQDLQLRQKEIVTSVNIDYVERMKEGLKNWVDAGKTGYLTWGILHFRKK